MVEAPEFWVLIAFVLLLLGVGKRAFTQVTALLDAHAQKVAAQLEEAERLHHEALSLLETYTQKHQDALKQSEKIIALANEETLEFERAKSKEMDHLLAQKESVFFSRLARERDEILEGLRQEISDEAIGIVTRLLSQNEKERKALTQRAVKEIGQVVK